MKTFKYLLCAVLFGAAILTGCSKDDKKPATKPVIEINQPTGASEGAYQVIVSGDWALTNVKITVKAGDQTTTPVDEKTFKDPTTFEYEGVVEYPKGIYQAVVTVEATNEKGLSQTKDATVSIPEPAVDPDAPVLYNFAKEFVTVSRKAWNDNHAAGKIHQHTEKDGLIEDDVHYIPDSWSDPDESGVWTNFTVAGKTYNTGEALEIATRGFLMLMGYDAATITSGGGYGNFKTLSPAATLTAAIPETHPDVFKWGTSPYNESGNTAVGGAQTANGGPLRFGNILNGTEAGTPNVCRLDIMVSYAQRHLVWPFNNGAISNMCGYNSEAQRNQVNNEFFGTCCARRFYMMMVSFFEYMLNNNLMDASSITPNQQFDCTLFGNAKWD